MSYEGIRKQNFAHEAAMQALKESRPAEEFADEILQWAFRSVRLDQRYHRPSINAAQFDELVRKIKKYTKRVTR